MEEKREPRPIHITLGSLLILVVVIAALFATIRQSGSPVLMRAFPGVVAGLTVIVWLYWKK